MRTQDVNLHRLLSVPLLLATGDLALVPWVHKPAYSVLWHWYWHTHTDFAKWQYSDLLCGADWASYVIKTELLHLHRVTPRGRMTYLFLLPHLTWVYMGELQWSRHDSSKVSLSPCCCCLLELSLCYHTKGPVNDFGTNHDWDCLRIGHGWYYHQQHILIIILDPWDLEVNLHEPKVRDGSVPIPSNSNTQPRGWIPSASSSQNWEFTLETCAPESVIAIVSCLSIITGALLEYPTKCAIGSGLMKGTGATSGHPFFWTACSRVGFGLGSGREFWRSTVGCCWHGLTPHSLGSP